MSQGAGARPGRPGEPTPPPEPFAYLSRQGRFVTLAIREPVAMLAFFAVFFGIGVILFLVTLQGVNQGAEGALMAAVVLLVGFCGLGLVGMVIAWVRLRWKRDYVRVMGHSPWS